MDAHFRSAFWSGGGRGDSWSNFYFNIITGSGLMAILFYNWLNRNLPFLTYWEKTLCRSYPPTLTPTPSPHLTQIMVNKRWKKFSLIYCYLNLKSVHFTGKFSIDIWFWEFGIARNQCHYSLVTSPCLKSGCLNKFVRWR